MKKAISHVELCCGLCHEQMDRGRHFIFELATGSRRCPVEAVRELIAHPEVTVARQEKRCFVTNAELVKTLDHGNCERRIMLTGKIGPTIAVNLIE